VRALTRRPVTDPVELAAVVAECLADLEPGLAPLGRTAGAGEIAVDIACVDASRRLVLILCEIVAGPEAVLRAVEAGAWWGEHAALRARVFPGATVDPGTPPRTLVVAGRFTDRALRLIRALGPLAPTPVECRVFGAAEDVVVGLERLDVPPPVAAPQPEAPPSPRREPGAARAEVLIQQLERLRFSEGFR